MNEYSGTWGIDLKIRGMFLADSMMTLTTR